MVTRDVFQLELEKRNVVQATTDPVTGLIKNASAGGVPVGLDSPVNGESWYQASLLHHATNADLAVGYDDVDKVVFIRDDSNGVLRIATSSDGWNTLSLSNSKGLPADIASTLSGGLSKVLRFKNNIYMMGKNGSNLVGVYRAPPAGGNTAYSWSSALKQMGASATAIFTCFSASATNLYFGEYGDPVGGPSVWTSTDGDNWTQIYTEKGQGSPQRHIHAVSEDPYNAGHLWITLGDANAPREIIRSRDYGQTWETVTASSAFQGVQISFSKDYVYVAGDSARGSIVMIRKSDNNIAWGGHGKPSLIAVPAAAALGDAFYTNAYFGIIDELTGEYWSYATDTSAGGNIPGLFVTPHVGAPMMLAEKLAYTGGCIDIFDGWLWFGRYRRKLHAR